MFVPDRETFQELSYQGLDVGADRHQEDWEYVKFYIVDADTDRPHVYFMNTKTHRSHNSFRNAVGIGAEGGGKWQIGARTSARYVGPGRTTRRRWRP